MEFSVTVIMHHMKPTILSSVLLAGLGLICASTATAQIQLYAVRKEQVYRQTADNSINPYYFRFDAQLRTSGANDLSYVTLDGATGGQINLNHSGSYWSYNSQAYSSLAEMDAAYPTANYTFTAGGGIYNSPVTLDVDLATSWPDVQPILTGNTFSGLNQWDPSSGDFLMTFNSHQDVPDALYVLTYVTFYDKTTNDGNPIHWSLDNSATSLVLPSNLFVSGHEYYGYLQFFHQYSNDDKPYYGSLKDLTTSFSFTTATDNPGNGGVSPVPEASTYGLCGAGLLLGAISLRRFRKKASA